MQTDQKNDLLFAPVIDHVKNTANIVDCTGSALLIVQNGKITVEKYWGTHSKEENAKRVQETTQFHIASIRKCYIGFAAAYAVHEGFIRSIDDLVTEYIPTNEPELFEGVTIRHLLTHTHGLKKSGSEIQREFPAGESWAYRGVGINTLTEVIENATGKSIAEILTEQVFSKLNFTETGWHSEMTENLVDVIRDSDDTSWYNGTSVSGNERNMYVSVRELAKWGELHLNKGRAAGEPLVPSGIIELATSVQSPKMSDADLPQNGFLWFVKDLPAKQTEIGGSVPEGSFQILGYTGVTLLVIPKYNLVAVRAFNSFGSPAGYDYLEDVRTFGDVLVSCVE
ncbi:serine hydrolase domain-containing protein [Planomicrobium sp. Y74]|uniref:serine hydrolase domain-containing protein n=1 Tax=Planomicrobium sp. Y74 TaxID=2478977 RepID=UPI000EF4E966|nr:serine hydrolase domain-containing protein [Planomicrobium sp. Y74]RLQ90043.1 class A beta-lactamase-related serine hydrolase [Planomicrobium sp. Y74]